MNDAPRRPTPPLAPDDPRLTAFALGELDPAEHAAIADELASQPHLYPVVDDIRRTARELEAALAAEPLPETAPGAAAPIAPLLPFPPAPRVRPTTSPSARCPRGDLLIHLAAAACFLLVLTVLDRQFRAQTARARIELAAAESQRLATARASSPAATAGDQTRTVEIRFAENSRSPAAPSEPARLTPPPTAPAVIAATAPATPTVVSTASSGPDTSSDTLPALARDTAVATTTATPDDLRGDELAAAVALVNEHFLRGADPQNDAASPPFTYTDATELANIGGDFPGAPRGDRLDVPGGPLRRSTEPGVLLSGDDNSFDGSPRRASGGFFPPVLSSDSGAAPVDTEIYDHRAENRFLLTRAHPLSTFGIDVDTAAYANVRRLILSGRLPPPDAVRIEELINAFDYTYSAPAATDRAPIAVSIEIAAAPWAPTHRLVRIGLKARELGSDARPPANLVLLVDTSESMAASDKLPLLKESLRLLVEHLDPRDRIAIATFSDVSSLHLPSTPLAEKAAIIAAINRLETSGPATDAFGLPLAYDIVRANLAPGGVNRVILASDGAFNTGAADRGALVRLIQENARADITLDTFGFGTGTLRDSLLEQLAAHGAGAYAYIDSTREARRVFTRRLAGALAAVARDVKIQVEFDRTEVQAYRLIGYENRTLPSEAFADDRLDAATLGAGDTITALYDVVPVGATWSDDADDGTPAYTAPSAREIARVTARAARKPRLFELTVRYQPAGSEKSTRLSAIGTDSGRAFVDASTDFKFAAAVAGFGLVLRDSPYKGGATFADIAQWADQSLGPDPEGRRHEFLDLIDHTRRLVR